MKFEENFFDLIVYGTGLEESVVASSVADIKKKVLQLEHSNVYGNYDGSFNLQEILSYFESDKMIYPENRKDGINLQKVDSDFIDVEVFTTKFIKKEDYPKYILELSPKIICGKEQIVEYLVNLGAHHYIDFRTVENSYLYDNYEFFKIPITQNEIFCDKSLSNVEKRKLTRFIQEASNIIGEKIIGKEYKSEDITLSSWLNKYELSIKMQKYIKYGIFLCNSDEIDLSIKEALEHLSIYFTSISYFVPETGPFILPCYGSGDIVQGLCRSTAVRGSTIALNCGIKYILVKERNYEVITTYDQKLTCEKLLLPSYFYKCFEKYQKNPPLIEKIARAICITERSLINGKNQVLLIVPPYSISNTQKSSIFILQQSHPVCPKEQYCIYLLYKGHEARNNLRVIIEMLFDLSEIDKKMPNNRPKIYFMALYDQIVIKHFSVILPNIYFTSSTSDNIDSADMIKNASYNCDLLYPQATYFDHLFHRIKHNTNRNEYLDELEEILENMNE